ncbi:MAG: acyl-CoA thioesterase [Micromonosporaceae bacterium]
MPRFTYQCALRWSDMDAYGHVNNARFLTLYEEARVALLFGEDGSSSIERGVVIARHEIDYLRPVDYGTVSNGETSSRRVTIELWVDEVRPSRFTVAYEMRDGDALASRARSVLVPYDLVSRRPRRLTDAERAFLARWCDNLAAAGPEVSGPARESAR